MELWIINIRQIINDWLSVELSSILASILFQIKNKMEWSSSFNLEWILHQESNISYCKPNNWGE